VQKDESLFDFEVWISGLPAILGRNESQNEGPGTGENICLGDHTTLSRQHAKVMWDPTIEVYIIFQSRDPGIDSEMSHLRLHFNNALVPCFRFLLNRYSF
jgi:hypothetical protein